MKYEQRVHQLLKQRHGDWYVESPWFQYQEKGESRVRYCQPDGLLFDRGLGLVTIVEVKLRHTDKAWWQLRKKYGPVLAAVYPWMRQAYVEVVQWYDVSIPFPEPVNLDPDLRNARVDEIQVTIWKP